MEVTTRRREQEVWQACDDLWALFGDMKHLTGDGIRERLLSLGKSKGSPNEIYKYRKTWLVSRGVNISGETMSDASENDPISRAVRMVHEQLRDNTEARIEELKEEFAAQILAKEHQITEAKQALDNVIAEYGALEQKFSSTNLENRTLQQQMAAEIDLRRAMEKECQLTKSLAHTERQHAEQRIAELKAVFADETSQSRMREDALIREHGMLVKDLADRMQALGHEYSERLMQIKLALHNQEIKAEQAENKLAQVIDAQRALHDDLRAAKEAARRAQEEALRQKTIAATKDAQLLEKKHEHHQLLQKLAHLSRRQRQAELTIARLRAQRKS